MKLYRFVQPTIGISLAALFLTGCSTGAAPRVQTGQHAHTFRRGKAGLNYLLFLPQEYGQKPRKKWPLILFLHGMGERGDEPEDLEIVKVYGPPMIVEREVDFPFIVISPQCPAESYWTAELDNLDALLDEIVATYAVDLDRVYLTGLSMGGYGAWNLALRHPNRFAAIAPIAGGYVHESDAVPENICDLKDVPIWVFHGAQDTTVLPRQSEVMVDALRACGSDVRFTLYPDAEHDSWTETYDNPELYTWLLEHTR